MEQLICQTCGSPLRKEGDLYVCPYCGTTYRENQAEMLGELLGNALDAYQIESLAKARRQLYDAAHAKYPSDKAVIAASTAVLAIHPDDFLARVYLHSHDADPYSLIQILSREQATQSEVKDAYQWLLRSLDARVVGAVKDFADRHLEGKEKTEALNAIEAEALKIDEGVYNLSLKRDAFLCYSAEDMPKVIEIMDLLESNGLSCFAAFRNLRHGKGAQENYQSAIFEAMKNCRVFVFLSSASSRSPARKGVVEELDHLSSALPNKPRVEFLLEDYSPREVLAKKKMAQIFQHLEHCRDEEDLVIRVSNLLDAEENAEKERLKKLAEEAASKAREEIAAEYAAREAERKKKEEEERLKREERERQERAEREEKERLAQAENAKKEEQERLAREARAKEQKELEEQRLALEKARLELEKQKHDAAKNTGSTSTKDLDPASLLKMMEEAEQLKKQREEESRRRAEEARQAEERRIEEEKKRQAEIEAAEREKKRRKELEAWSKSEDKMEPIRLYFAEHCKIGSVITYGSFPQDGDVKFEYLNKPFGERQPVEWVVVSYDKQVYGPDYARTYVYLMSKRILFAYPLIAKGSKVAPERKARELAEWFLSQFRPSGGAKLLTLERGPCLPSVNELRYLPKELRWPEESLLAYKAWQAKGGRNGFGSVRDFWVSDTKITSRRTESGDRLPCIPRADGDNFYLKEVEGEEPYGFRFVFRVNICALVRYLMNQKDSPKQSAPAKEAPKKIVETANTTYDPKTHFLQIGVKETQLRGVSNYPDVETLYIPKTTVWIDDFPPKLSKLKKIIIAPDHPSAEMIGDSLVVKSRGPKQLVYVLPGREKGPYVLPEGVQEIVNGAFSYNENVTSINLENGSLKKVDIGAFDHISANAVYIPSTVEEVNAYQPYPYFPHPTQFYFGIKKPLLGYPKNYNKDVLALLGRPQWGVSFASVQDKFK